MRNTILSVLQPQRPWVFLGGGLVLIVAAFTSIANAEPKQMKGSIFVSTMQGNTLSGKTVEGVAFNAYFLRGGMVTYEDANGLKDTGQWRIDNEEDVCVAFKNMNDGKEECFFVTLDGRTVTWKGKTRAGTGMLRGSIVESFLQE